MSRLTSIRRAIVYSFSYTLYAEGCSCANEPICCVQVTSIDYADKKISANIGGWKKSDRSGISCQPNGHLFYDLVMHMLVTSNLQKGQTCVVSTTWFMPAVPYSVLVLKFEFE